MEPGLVDAREEDGRALELERAVGDGEEVRRGGQERGEQHSGGRWGCSACPAACECECSASCATGKLWVIAWQLLVLRPG